MGDPESIMLSTMTEESDRERQEKDIMVPWLKFLWETYRAVLEVLRTMQKVRLGFGLRIVLGRRFGRRIVLGLSLPLQVRPVETLSVRPLFNPPLNSLTANPNPRFAVP